MCRWLAGKASCLQLVQCVTVDGELELVQLHSVWLVVRSSRKQEGRLDLILCSVSGSECELDCCSTSE